MDHLVLWHFVGGSLTAGRFLGGTAADVVVNIISRTILVAKLAGKGWSVDRQATVYPKPRNCTICVV